MSARYEHTNEVHNLKAPAIIVPDLICDFHPTSVIDVGCGTGTFLGVFQSHGVIDLLGVDGPWVEKGSLHFDRRNFKEVDLEEPLCIDRTFDLALCLEVAEHLRPEAADTIIASLCSLSKLIVFSAAVPGQGGQNHLNEQPFDYWQEKFLKLDYHFFDIFRDRYWEKKDVDWWYKQNMFLAAHASFDFAEEIRCKKLNGPALLHIHPDLYLGTRAELAHLKSKVDGLKSFKRILRAAQRFAGKRRSPAGR